MRFATLAVLAMSAVGIGLASPARAGLPAGEYSCIGVGGQVLAGLGFRTDGNGNYRSLDNADPGRIVDAGPGTIKFQGGFLDGQLGTGVKGIDFNIHSASCQRIR